MLNHLVVREKVEKDYCYVYAKRVAIYSEEYHHIDSSSLFVDDIEDATGWK